MSICIWVCNFEWSICYQVQTIECGGTAGRSWHSANTTQMFDTQRGGGIARDLTLHSIAVYTVSQFTQCSSPFFAVSSFKCLLINNYWVTSVHLFIVLTYTNIITLCAACIDQNPWLNYSPCFNFIFTNNIFVLFLAISGDIWACISRE